MRSSNTATIQSGTRPITLLTDLQLSTLPDPRWIVDGMIPEGGLAAVVGAPGVGKTTLTVDIMMRVALGLPVFGRPTTPGPVIYIAAEGVNGLKARAAAWKQANGIEQVEDIYFITEPIQLLHERETLGLLEAIEHRDISPSLLVVDTLARCFEGGDENSAEAMGRLIGSTGRLVKRLGATVLLNHHTRKAGDVERGSSALRGALDSMLMVTEDGGVVTVSCEKMKDAEPFKPFRLRRTSIAGSCVLEHLSDSDALFAAANVPPGLKGLLSFLGDSTQPIRVAEVRDRANLKDTTCRRWLRQLVDQSLVVEHADGRFEITEQGLAVLGSGDATTTTP
jgi:hypothetical protein